MTNQMKPRQLRIAPELRDFVNRKQTTNVIAKRHGISPSTLTARAKKAGLPLRKRGRWHLTEPSPQQKQILQMVESNTYAQVGVRFGVSKQRVSQLVRRWKNWMGRESTGRRGFRKRKPRIVSFRIEDAAFHRLNHLLKHPWFKNLRSTGGAAREIVYKYLRDVFPETPFSSISRVVNPAKKSEAL